MINNRNSAAQLILAQRFRISISNLLLSLYEFKNVIARNKAVRKKALHGIRFFPVDLHAGAAAFQDVRYVGTGLAGVEKHKTTTDVLETRRAEDEGIKSARIDVGDFKNVQDDVAVSRIQEK